MNDQIKLLNDYWTDIYFHLRYIHKDKISHQVVRILQLVAKQKNIGINEIASFIQVSHNTASEHVKRIIKKGYLIKKRGSLDERKVILCLTSLGEQVLQRNTSLDEAKLEQILKQLNNNEINTIERGLEILSRCAKKCIY